MAYRIVALLVTLSAAAGGCARATDDFIVPAGHPADPAARPGLSLPSSTALESELKDVRPQVTPATGTPQPQPSSGQHKH